MADVKTTWFVDMLLVFLVEFLFYFVELLDSFGLFGFGVRSVSIITNSVCASSYLVSDGFICVALVC